MRIGADSPAIVTGGASGLGEATARALAEAGAPVAILDRDATRGAAAARAIDGLFFETDVTAPESIAASLAAARAAQGQERICVTCAGIGPAAKTVSKGAAHDPALFEKTIAVNLLGSFYAASQSAAGMVAAEPLRQETAQEAERGVIVLTASIAAFDGQIGQAAYAASKGGIAGLALPMARDLARDGVRVAAIAPGLFATPMLLGLPQEVQDSLGAQVPFPPRLGKPEEFARFARQIIENPMLNGSVYRLDGALRMGPR